MKLSEQEIATYWNDGFLIKRNLANYELMDALLSHS